MDSQNTSTPNRFESKTILTILHYHLLKFLTSLSSTEQNESQKNLELTKAKVDEVVDIMRQNVNKIVDRGTNLDAVDQRSEALRQSALQFQGHSEKLQRKHWWANVKMRIALGVVGVVLIILIVGKKKFFFIMKDLKPAIILILVWIVYG